MRDGLDGDYTWLFDLIAPDEGVRRRALDRHQRLLIGEARALDQVNAIWARTGTPAPTQPRWSAAMDQANADLTWHRNQTIRGPGFAFLRTTGDAAARSRYAPYALLDLQWEDRYPEEWGAPESWLWSPWGRKENLLGGFDRLGVPNELRGTVGDLIVSVIGRPYRCKDWMYACLVRHVDGDGFRDRVASLLDADDPLVRLRARFVQHVAANPGQRVKRVSFRRWLG